MTEPGSDELLAQAGSLEHAALPLEAEEAALDAEEERLESLELPAVDDEPGEDHPDPDEAPPSDQAHDEFDPLPEEGADAETT